MSDQEKLTQPDHQTVHKNVLGRWLGGHAIAAGLGVGIALLASGAHGNEPPKHETVKTAETYDQVLEKVSNPQKADEFMVAHATITLKEGAKVTDIRGNESVLTKEIGGIQNPAWTPKANVLCFSPEKGQATCFDKVADASYMTVLITGTDGKPKVIAAEALTPDNAVHATVTTIEGDGFAYGHVDGSDEYIAGRPSMEGDTVPVPSLPTN